MAKSIQAQRSEQSITLTTTQSKESNKTKETWHKNPKHVDLNIKGYKM